MSRAHFTVGEVEALIPKLDRAGVQVTRDDAPSADIEAGPPAVRQAKAVFRGLDEALNDELERIRALGGEVKDLDLGLVDFPSARNGEEILLCWKLGEKSLGYWHSVDGGFASRRPIDAQISSAPSRLD